MISDFYSRLSCQQQLFIQIGIGLAFVFIYMSPYLIQGMDTPFLIHDNLDCGSIQVWRIYHGDSLFWLPTAASPMLMNGALPAFGGPNLKWDNMLYYFLPPFTAYVTLQIIARIIAFTSMWLFLRSLFPAGRNRRSNDLICTGVAILFSMLPCTASFNVSALPFLTWIMLKIAQRKDHRMHWWILCMFPFFTSFLMAPVFLLILVGVIWVFAAIIWRRVNWRWLGALILVSTLYCISMYDLVIGCLDKNFISHRVEFQTVGISLKAVFSRTITNFYTGQYHVATHHLYLVPLFIITVGVALVIWVCHLKDLFFKERAAHATVGLIRCDRTFHLPLGIVVGTFALAGAISLWYGLYQWSPIVSLRQSLSIINMVPLLSG
ncbi:MAG: DUF6044 family protein [bacterium]